MCSKMTLEYQQQQDGDARKVLRKLAIHERTIKELFKLSRFPCSIIKQKLTEINELIVDIPAGLGEGLVHQWTMKLARWWELYDDSMMKSRENSSTNLTDSFDNEIQKNNMISTRIIRQFKLIPPIQSETDLYGLQKLFSAIFKTRFLIDDCWLEEPHLHAEVFLLAISKLPRELCHKFAQEYNPQDRRQLGDLRIFVEDLLRAQIGDIGQRIEQEFAKLPSVTSSSDIAEMKRLLLQVSQTLKLVHLPFDELDKVSLYSSVSNCLLIKLPPEMSKLFEQVSRFDRSPFSRLKHLRLFIANQIVQMSNSPLNIADKMKHELSNLAKVNSASCIEPIKCLLTWASKAQAYIRALKYNRTIKQLQSDLADLALSKLSLDLQQKCAQSNCENRDNPLFKVIKVLSKCVTDYYASEKATQAEQIQQVKSVVRECASNGDNAKFCNYCHSVGHWTRQCELIKSMTCFRCLQAGHNAKYCTGAPYGPLWNKPICIECAQFGHLYRFCPTVICNQCNQSGHIFSQCTY